MSEALFPYYERELLFVRQLAQDFARQYPAAAGRLLLEPNRSADPHVERLIEAFALLAGRIHHKLDDEFPELTDALLNTLYPHYLAPIPSMGIVQFDLDEARAQLPKGFAIPRGSRLRTQPVNGLPCRYRTAYPVTLWPLRLSMARWQPPPFPSSLQAPPRTAAILRLQFDALGGTKISDLTLDRLRFFLSGDNQVIPPLYELLFNHVFQVMFRSVEGDAPGSTVILLPEQCLFQVGFEPEDGLLPYPRRSFLGYRLLTEFFTFPSKFLFLDLGGWKQAARAGFGKRVEVVLFLNRTLRNVEQAVEPAMFRQGCAPVINLFEQVAEPIPLTQTKHEYRILPDVAFPQGMEVYSVESVVHTDPTTNSTTEYRPFYSFRHALGEDEPEAFYYAARRPSMQPDDHGTEVQLSLVDLKFNPLAPAEATLVVKTICTNRDLPTRLQLAGENLTFELEAAAPLRRVNCIRTPTAPLRPPPRRGGAWRLVSHMILNHLSLADPTEGLEALHEILTLYDFSDPEMGQQMANVNRQLVEGIVAMTTRRVVGRVGGEIASGFCRGIEVDLEFDEQKYIGTGVFLFASVLERFFGLYASLNSFSQLVGRTSQGEGPFKRWPPRAGELALV